MKYLLVAFFSIVLAAMAWVTITASLDRDVLTAASEIWSDPWGRATLFDAYFAFLTVYLWIAWRQPTWLSRAIWLVLILCLGNFAIAAYALLALRKASPENPGRDLFSRPARASAAQHHA